MVIHISAQYAEGKSEATQRPHCALQRDGVITKRVSRWVNSPPGFTESKLGEVCVILARGVRAWKMNGCTYGALGQLISGGMGV